MRRPRRIHINVVNLRTAREEAGLSVTDMAEVVGISQGHLSNVEAGRDNLGMVNLRKIAEFHKLPVDHFIQSRISIAQNRDEAILLSVYRRLSPETAKTLVDVALAMERGQKTPNDCGRVSHYWRCQ